MPLFFLHRRAEQPWDQNYDFNKNEKEESVLEESVSTCLSLILRERKDSQKQLKIICSETKNMKEATMK